MNKLQCDVVNFHLKFGQHVGEFKGDDGIDFSKRDLVAPRSRWLREEVQELFDAYTVGEAADAYVDIIYLAVGGLVELGVDLDTFWDEVHEANMRKQKIKNEDGKVTKPSGWEGPNTEKCMRDMWASQK